MSAIIVRVKWEGMREISVLKALYTEGWGSKIPV